MKRETIIICNICAFYLYFPISIHYYIVLILLYYNCIVPLLLLVHALDIHDVTTANHL